jgi:hypothetical protein
MDATAVLKRRSTSGAGTEAELDAFVEGAALERDGHVRSAHADRQAVEHDAHSAREAWLDEQLTREQDDQGVHWIGRDAELLVLLVLEQRVVDGFVDAIGEPGVESGRAFVAARLVGHESEDLVITRSESTSKRALIQARADAGFEAGRIADRDAPQDLVGVGALQEAQDFAFGHPVS